jgi:MarR family transcriptional regulator, lower aerobic nicotinate degradation pathway regulator
MLRHARLKSIPGRADAGRSHRYLLEEQVGFLMRVASQRHAAIFMSGMVDGLTPPQFCALAKLLDVGPCSQNHLGRLIYLDAATIKGVIDRLRARRLVTSQSDPQDKRRRSVALTESGRRVAEAAVAVAGHITVKTLAPLTPEEQRTIVRLLKKLG